MRKVPPSEVVREEINHILEGAAALDSGTNLLSTLSELGVRYLLQQALEQEQEDFLGRGRYERTRSQQSTTSTAKRGYRNGYEDATLNTAEGRVGVRVPQVRDTSAPYRSKLMEFLEGNSEALERLLTEMYARGLSTRDVEECFRDASTGELMISRSALLGDHRAVVGRLSRAFCERDLSEIEVEYTCSWTPSTSL